MEYQRGVMTSVITRRDLICKTCKAALSTFILSNISCDIKDNVLSPHAPNSKITNAETIMPLGSVVEVQRALSVVNEYCKQCLSDDALINRKSIETFVEEKYENAWDYILVMDGFNIERAYYHQENIIVSVNYSYIGSLKGDSWHPRSNNINNNSYMTINYLTKRLNDGIIIINVLPRISSRQAIYNYINSLIEKTISDNNNMPLIFEKRLQNLNRSLISI